MGRRPQQSWSQLGDIVRAGPRINAPTYLVFFELARRRCREADEPSCPHAHGDFDGGRLNGRAHLYRQCAKIHDLAISHRRGVKMPSFFGYMLWSGRSSCRCSQWSLTFSCPQAVGWVERKRDPRARKSGSDIAAVGATLVVARSLGNRVPRSLCPPKTGRPQGSPLHFLGSWSNRHDRHGLKTSAMRVRARFEIAMAVLAGGAKCRCSGRALHERCRDAAMSMK